MNKVAQNVGKNNWLEKTPRHAFYLNEISAHFPEAKFIGITRKLDHQIASFILWKKNRKLIGSSKKMEIIKAVVIFKCSSKHMNRFKSKHPEKIIIIQYEHLKESTLNTTKKICLFLDIKFEEKMLEKADEKLNSSFQGNTQRDNALTK